LPEVALSGTTAEIWLGEITVKSVAVLPMLTWVTQFKLIPVMVTTVPYEPEEGARLVSVETLPPAL
jgi:hypothetical protein